MYVGAIRLYYFNRAGINAELTIYTSNGINGVLEIGSVVVMDRVGGTDVAAVTAVYAAANNLQSHRGLTFTETTTGLLWHDRGAKLSSRCELLQKFVLITLAGPSAGFFKSLFKGFATEKVCIVMIYTVDRTDRNAGIAVDALLRVDGVHEVIGIKIMNCFRGTDTAAIAAVDTEPLVNDICHSSSSLP
tara:strand:- start:36 stop:602 length:567 start_codon:yes stop_codon:yes gene_type:complete